MSGTDTGDMLLIMAGKDLKALNALITPDSADDEIFGFHAQQVVEKSLKAWIAAIGGMYGRTHDIAQLLCILENLGCDMHPFESLVELNPFAVGFRYEVMDFDEPALDRKDILSRVQALHKHVGSILHLSK